MAMETRGGFPIFRRIASIPATSAGRVLTLPSATKHVQITNTGAEVLRVYATLAFFTADAALDQTDNFLDIADGNGFWEGPAEVEKLWFRAEANTTNLILVAYARR